VHNYMVEFKVNGNPVSNFICIYKVENEEEAKKIFIDKKPPHWTYVGIREIWFQEEPDL